MGFQLSLPKPGSRIGFIKQGWADGHRSCTAQNPCGRKVLPYVGKEIYIFTLYIYIDVYIYMCIYIYVYVYILISTVRNFGSYLVESTVFHISGINHCQSSRYYESDR